MGDVGAAYAGCRARIAQLAGHLDETQAATTVPTCPEWTVHDVVAHVTGVAADVLAGRLEGVASDAWTAAQVEARRAQPIADILAEWSAIAPSVTVLRVHATDGSEFGDHDATVVLNGDPFELLRAMTGRRSVARSAR